MRGRSSPHGLCVTNYDWAEHAACKGQPLDLFFDKYSKHWRDDTEDRALEFCFRCKVAAECLDYAVRNNCDGIWGGFTQQQRERGVHRLSPIVPLNDEGLYAQKILRLHRQGFTWTQISQQTGLSYRKVARMMKEIPAVIR